MIFVETEKEFHNLVNEMELGQECYIVPILTDKNAHPVVNNVCAFFIQLKDKNYFVPFSHTETLNLSLKLLNNFPKIKYYTPTKKILLHLADFGDDVLDLKGLEYLTTGACEDETKFYTNVMKSFYGRLNATKDVNKIVPVFHLIKFLQNYLSHLKQYLDNSIIESKGFKFHNNVIVEACHLLESGGVHVDVELFTHYYGQKYVRSVVNDLVYTEYNPYTSSGRVSNKHYGINYAAIEKKNGTRRAFTSRFSDGALVLIDFESFHLRLIADLINFDLPDEPVHEYLAKQYFKTQQITPEQYEQGKALTFKYLYSNSREGDYINFFSSVYDFIDSIWEKCTTSGFYTFQSGHVLNISQIDNPSPGKIFNYILQWRETEVAMESIKCLKDVFQHIDSKLCMYTYDSILCDIRKKDIHIIHDIISILENNGKYPVRLYVGPNYHDLKIIPR